MSIRIETYSVDARDPYTIARWWALALGWEVTDGGPGGDEVSIAPRATRHSATSCPSCSSARCPRGRR